MSLIVNKIPLKAGDKLRVTRSGEINGYGIAKEIVTVEHIYDSKTIGITSEHAHPNWGDLDGRVASGHGFYVNPSIISENFERVGVQYTVSEPYKYNDIDLTGKTCSVLFVTSDHEINFVEFEEDIGGGGCDGLGKHGHCIAVPAHVLSMSVISQPKTQTEQIKKAISKAISAKNQERDEDIDF